MRFNTTVLKAIHWQAVFFNFETNEKIFIVHIVFIKVVKNFKLNILYKLIFKNR